MPTTARWRSEAMNEEQRLAILKAAVLGAVYTIGEISPEYDDTVRLVTHSLTIAGLDTALEIDQRAFVLLVRDIVTTP